MSTKRKKKKSAGRRAAIILGTVIGTAIFVALILVAVVVHYIRKMNYVPLKEAYSINETTEEFIEDITNPDEETSADSSQQEIDEYKQAAEEALAGIKDDYEPIGDVYNVLLIGSDTRKSGGTGRSDTMLLISINKTENKIVATSFLRDIYCYIPEVGYQKLNAAYAYQGIELLLDTLKYNFSIEVDRYIAVDFYSFIKVVDILGGIDVDVQSDELYWLNQYIHASNLLTDSPEHEGYIDSADGSYIHLNGKQALAYARFRYVGNGDFTRTERQRKVVNIIFDKLSTINVETLLKLLDSVLPEVTTNIPTGEFIELIGILPTIKKYDIVSWNIPDNGFKYLTIDGISYIGIEFDTYIDELYDKIYGSNK